MSIFIILILGIGFLAIIVATMYNSLVRGRQRVREAWSDIEVQLQRRYDLIPNLVETVKGYAAHEKELFENVTKARTAALEAEKTGDPKKIGEAENALSGTLKTLFAVAENYPDLKASENFLQLQKDLTDTEDKIQAARRFYNGNVRDYNIKIESFPSNIIASMFGFKQMDLFDIEEAEARKPVEVKF